LFDCVGCHNQRLQTAALALDTLDAANPAAHAEVWEKVVRKLRTRVMPPLGSKRPDEATYRTIVGQLETALDRGAAAHTDYGMLTILSQDPIGGLELRTRSGEWVAAPYIEDTLVINLGDIVQVWSNDRYRAALHRVVVADPTHERYSIPFFFNPSYDTTYEPLPPTVTRERPAAYRRIQWREFRSLRAAGDYADLGVEVQVDHYRA